MKILYVSNGSNFSSAGGMEYHLIDITNWLGGKGVETALAVRKGTFLARNLLDGRRNVYPLSWTGPAKIYSFFQVVKAILDFSPDIISINRERDIKRFYFIAKSVGLFLKKKPKIVSVFHNLGWRSRFKLERLDGIIFPNRYIKQDYVPRHGGAETKSAVIYHGIHLPRLTAYEKNDPNRKRKYFKEKKFPLIGMVGELRKNQSELIDVAFHLKGKIRDFTVAIVGWGTDRETESLKGKINQLGLSENIILTGRVDKHQMQNIFYDLDLSVTTNRTEPFGLVFIESLASYTPLIAYNSGGPVEILEKGGGILVNGGPEEMAENIFAVISNDRLRRSLAAAGRNAAEKYFSIDAMGEAHLDFYLNIMNGRSQRSYADTGRKTR